MDSAATPAVPGTVDATVREDARQRMMALLREGLPLGYVGGLERDALHTRRSPLPDDAPGL